MQLPTQQQFVNDCLSKYRWEPLPADQKWEEAHFPLPQCSGEDNTVMLWSADHTVQGLLQSVEFDHKCFYYAANSKDLYNLETHYPEYLPLFAQLKSHFSSRQGKKTAELKVGVCGRSAEKMTADGKKGGKIGGKKAAVTNQVNCTSIFAPGKTSKGGKKSGAQHAKNKTGVCGRSAEKMTADGKKGGKKASAVTNAQRYKCLVTGFISAPGPLALYQKKRGIDTKLRVKLVIQSLSS